tara:strand:- start:470 stop:673 length:204 start_codon:yes stop_codon:yes gene_type:complete
MKIFSFIFRPQYLIRELQKENNALKFKLAELTDENQSLWDMLDEIKAADEEAMNYKSLINTKSIGEA